ncbi:hypothetical protein OHA37_27960 [Streptomyces sp. NBC_00335]|uniref:hypothetical protein n=1 Tax=unclassified Streptomyces TaxID=2593676 RepID=UPI00224F1E82|nr:MULTISPECIES: hypothetical protein [unclassified Streptomyces]MCX5407687.1 hypothetical protein [Streptomyces sp. NBC_00086]
MSHSPAPMRATRAAVFAAVAVALGAAGHSYMSGTDLPALVLLSAFGLTGGLAWLSAGRRRGPLPIAASLLAVQAVLHLLFSSSPAGGRHRADADAGAGMDMGASAGAGREAADALHGVHSVSGMEGMSGMAGMGDVAAGHAHDGLGMIAAHALAGLFCALWLAWGEAAVFRLAAALAAGALLAARPLSRVLALLRARAIPVPPARAFPPAGYERPRTLRGAVHAHTAERRGPPARGRIRITAPGRPARA